MNGLRTLVATTVARASAGLAMAVAAAFLVSAPPLAGADPTSDADAAITAAWEAGGGATGSLGVKDGGVYPAGTGFGQNFAGGKIYFTPQTGAHIMQGAILDKYVSLGGPADGDLGFPNIDEGGGKAPGSRNTTFSAADNPVIFWTPDTGAHVVRGAINAAWDKLGGSAAVLGVPSEDEVYRGDVVSQNFTGGQVTWDRKTGAFTTTPPDLASQLTGLAIPGDATTAIDAARRAAGGATGPLGAPDGGQYKVGADGLGQNYAGGKIFYSPATGAGVLSGQVLAKYESVGGPEGDLGFPIGNEGDGGLKPASTIASFAAADKPVIFWTPDFGAVIVRGAMNAAWQKLGGATGDLGAPTADQTENGGVITQKFNGGAISWNTSTKAFSTEPANLATQLAGLQVPELQGPRAPAPGQVKDTGTKWYQAHEWWLLAIVPVAVLLIAVVIGLLLNRRRRDDRVAVDDFEDDFEDDHDDHGEHGDRHDDFDDLAPHGPHDYESGPMPIVAPEGDARYAPVSMWAMPTERPSAPAAGLRGPADEDEIDTAPTRIEAEPPTEAVARQDLHGSEAKSAAGALDGARDDGHDGARPGGHDDDFDDDFDDEPDDFDDVRPRDDANDGRDDAAFEDDTLEDDGFDDEPDSGPPSGRHAAIQLDDAAPAQTSLRLATNDPYRAPDGYPIKADTATGLYYAPGSARYDRARAEIWFASEEFAVTNGFVKG